MTTTTTTTKERRSPKSEPRMIGAELLAEVDWLLDGGVHPLMVAEELKRTPSLLEVTARRHGRPDLVAIFSPFAHSVRKAS